MVDPSCAGLGTAQVAHLLATIVVDFFLMLLLISLLLLMVMLLSWPCLLLLIPLYLVVVNKSYSNAVDFVVVVFIENVVVLALFVVIGHILFSCDQ